MSLDAVTLVGAILAIGFLIVVHEAGHYFVARWCNMRVDRFSIGFGPPILTRKRGETDFTLGPIPFGGFVQINGMLLSEDVDPDDPRAYPNRPVWQRFLTIFAGPATNYLAAIVLAFVFYNAVGVRASTARYVVGGVAAGEGFDAEGKLEEGDVILRVNGTEVYAQIDGEPPAKRFVDYVQQSKDRPLRVAVRRGGEIKDVELRPLAVPEYEQREVAARLGIDIDTASQGDVVRYRVATVAPKSPAAGALETGDVILAVGGENVYARSGEDLSAKSLIRALDESSGPLSITVDRGGAKKTVQVTPAPSPIIADRLGVEVEEKDGRAVVTRLMGGRLFPQFLPGDVVAGPEGEPLTADQLSQRVAAAGADIELVALRDGHRIPLDVALAAAPTAYRVGIVLDEERADVGVLEAAGHAFTYPVRQTEVIIVGLYEWARGQVEGELMSVVGITAEVKRQIDRGWTYLIQVLMLLNVYLGLFNLFPLPALDGGRLVFLGYEMVTRRRANPKIEATVHMVGIMALMLLLVVVTYKDCARELGRFF